MTVQINVCISSYALCTLGKINRERIRSGDKLFVYKLL